MIYDHAPALGSVLVPSSDKRGSNAVLRRPAALFPLRFGNDSFMPHLASAIATNTSCVVLSLSGIGLDVDTPEDLYQLAEAPGEKPSQLLARELLRNQRRAPALDPALNSQLAAES
jgi:2-phospho-L-lactate guanylyltransferase